MQRILIVDDHPSFRGGAAALLRAEGFDVVGEAATAEAAVAEAARLRPDVVLLDVNLPDADGFAVCRRLCDGDAARPVIVLVSSRDADDYAGPAIACGARGFIAKADLSGPALSAILAA